MRETKRSKLEVMAEILFALEKGETGITRIMYRVNASWGQVVTDLETMSEKGLVNQRTEGKNRVYSLTTEGLEVSHLWRELKKKLTKESTNVE